MSVILKVDNLDMQYSSGNRSLSVLQSINMSIEEGETVAITGPSGSGKTTLMGLCAALDNPTSGAITLLGTLINPLSEDERARLRNRFVGFIFQNFQLLPSLTALEKCDASIRIARHQRRRSGSGSVADQGWTKRPDDPLSITTIRWRAATGGPRQSIYQ